MNFKWAYARSDANYSDEMLVLVSKDCGANWTQVFYRTGTSLVTGPTQTTPYIPDSTTLWKTANISLNSYISFSSVLIKIVNVTDGGNNLYIDNINLGQSLLVTGEEEISMQDVSVFPNPANDLVNVVVPANLNGEKEICIRDVLGKTILKNQFSGDSYVLDTQNISAGVHFITLKYKGQLVVKKLVIQK